jgi:hypothetical protein
MGLPKIEQQAEKPHARERKGRKGQEKSPLILCGLRDLCVPSSGGEQLQNFSSKGFLLNGYGLAFSLQPFSNFPSRRLCPLSALSLQPSAFFQLPIPPVILSLPGFRLDV